MCSVDTDMSNTGRLLVNGRPGENELTHERRWPLWEDLDKSEGYDHESMCGRDD